MGPSLVAAGFQREDDVFFIDEYDTSVEFTEAVDGPFWWMVLIIDAQLRCECKMDSITQALRVLWSFGLVGLVEQEPALAETPLPTP